MPSPVLPFPTKDQTKKDAIGRAGRLARNIKSTCASVRQDAAAGLISGYLITKDLLPALTGTKADLSAIAAIPNIAQAYEDEFGTPAAEISASFVQMFGALDDLIGWIEDNLPKANGRLSYETITTNRTGVITSDEFTPAQTASLRAAIEAFEATIA